MISSRVRSVEKEACEKVSIFGATLCDCLRNGGFPRSSRSEELHDGCGSGFRILTKDPRHSFFHNGDASIRMAFRRIATVS